MSVTENTAQPNARVKAFLSSLNEREQVASNESIITLNSKDTAENALRVLVDNKILSAPVIDQEQGKVVGLVSMRELTSVVLDILETRPASPRTSRTPANRHTNDVISAHRDAVPDPSTVILQAHNQNLASEFSRISARFVSEFAQADNVRFLPKNSNLLEVARVLSEGHIHRVLITEDTKLVNIITQSAIMKIIAKNIDQLGELGDATVEQLGFGKRQVMCVQDTEITATAFRQMLELNVSAMAVVSSNHNKLVSNLSFTDLKGIDKGYKITTLLLPVHQFLVERIRSQMIDIKAPTISCTPTSNLKTIILRMVAANIHRIYIVDDVHHPIGIITMTDILRILSA